MGLSDTDAVLLDEIDALRRKIHVLEVAGYYLRDRMHCSENFNYFIYCELRAIAAEMYFYERKSAERITRLADMIERDDPARTHRYIEKKQDNPPEEVQV